MKQDSMSVNNSIWDKLYQTYQKGVNVPGVKYPNEHLVRFVSALTKQSSAENLKAVELGFGNITNMTMMARHGYQVVGLEVSQESVDRAQSAIKSRGLENQLSVQTFIGNTLPLPDASADLIVGLQCVYYNLDQKTFARECARVLRPGGKIFFSFFSPRHGYMNYIEGKPGGIVKFTDQHPNDRLHGLELFLFKSKDQFEEIYGPYFDLAIGVDEFDTEPLFMSWTYVAGFAKKGLKKVSYPISEPSCIAMSPMPEYGHLDQCQKENQKLWNDKYDLRYRQGPNPGSQYPNEHCIRFLATKNRGGAGKFYKNVGREDQVKSEGEAMLEIMPENATNLLMAEGFGYKAHGLTFSKLAAEKTRQFVSDKQSSIQMSVVESTAFPFEKDVFDCVISEKAGSYFLYQKDFIREIARIVKPGAKIFIGYLSPRHGYFQWAEPLGANYYRLTKEHPDKTMRGMVVFSPSKEILKDLWEKDFEVEIKCTEFNMHLYFSSFYFVKATRI